MILQFGLVEMDILGCNSIVRLYNSTIMIQILILECIIMLSQKIVEGSALEFILYTILCLGGLIANFFIFFHLRYISRTINLLR